MKQTEVDESFNDGLFIGGSVTVYWEVLYI